MGQLCVHLGPPWEPCPPPPLPSFPEGPDQAPLLPISQLREGWGPTRVTKQPGAQQGQEPRSHRGGLLPLVTLGEGGTGAPLASSAPICLPTGTLGLCLAHEALRRCRGRVGGFSTCRGAKTRTPGLGRPVADAVPGSSVSQLCGLGQVFLPLCAWFLTREMASSPPAPHPGLWQMDD